PYGSAPKTSRVLPRIHRSHFDHACRRGRGVVALGPGHPGRAPSGTRTHTVSILSRPPLPIGLWGPGGCSLTRGQSPVFSRGSAGAATDRNSACGVSTEPRLTIS